MKNPSVKTKSKTINYSKLLGRMAEQRHTRKSLAQEVGVSETSLGKWILNGAPLHTNVIWALAEVLDINTNDFPIYFFQTYN